jgi:hypothetical protein
MADLYRNPYAGSGTTAPRVPQVPKPMVTQNYAAPRVANAFAPSTGADIVPGPNNDPYGIAPHGGVTPYLDPNQQPMPIDTGIVPGPYNDPNGPGPHGGITPYLDPNPQPQPPPPTQDPNAPPSPEPPGKVLSLWETLGYVGDDGMVTLPTGAKITLEAAMKQYYPDKPPSANEVPPWVRLSAPTAGGVPLQYWQQLPPDMRAYVQQLFDTVYTGQQTKPAVANMQQQSSLY